MMKCWILLMTFLIGVPMHIKAQIAAEGWVIENIHGPSQVGIVDTIPVDLNQDGLMDVVSASIDDGNLRAYINQGGLQFEQQLISTHVEGAFRVSAVDLNDDDVIDFLLPSIETQQIIAIIADSQADPYGYRQQIIAENILLPTDAQAGDFNEDGLMDVVSLSFEENLLLLHLQQIDGSFNTTTISDSILKPRKVVIDDFNGDLNLDILLASEEDNSVRLYTGDGGAAFLETLVSDQLDGIRHIARCDDETSTLPDFVAAVSGANQLVLFENQGNNTFIQTIIDPDLAGASAAHCADTDNDQLIELIAISTFDGAIYSYEIENTIAKNLVANTRDGYVNVSFANFKQGSEPRIISQAFFENRNVLLAPQSTNNETVVWQDFPDGVTKAARVDLNDDGVLDTVATSFTDNRLQWYDGRNNNHNIIAENIKGAADLVVGDLNQDGYIDIVSAASFDNRFYLHMNDEGQGFNTTVLYDGALFANSLTLADLDQDGWLDVLGTSGTDNRLRWFKFTENETQVTDLGIPGSAPNDVEIGDIDDDGDMDIAVVNFFSGDVVFYENNANNEFNLQVISGGWARPYAVLLRQNEGAGFLNLVVTMSADNSVVEFIQNTYQEFQQVLILDGINNPRKIAAGALENEILVTSPDNKSIIKKNENGETTEVVSDYLGVSDIKLYADTGQWVSGSSILNSVSSLTRDLIFFNKFEAQKD